MNKPSIKQLTFWTGFFGFYALLFGASGIIIYCAFTLIKDCILAIWH